MEELEIRLKRIGKGAFVKNFDTFQSYAEGKKTKDDAVKKLMKKHGGKESSANTRLSNAKKVFNEGLKCRALENVSCANPTSLGKDGHNTIATAQELIKKHCQ